MSDCSVIFPLRISVGSSTCNLVLDRRGCPGAFVEPSSAKEEELGMLQILLTRYHGPTWDKRASKEETDTGSWASLMNAIKWDATNARKRSDDKAKSMHREIITGEITRYKPDEV
ncbi:hypothetical protein ALC57_12118 [Trachymyrmex cornetzi]|uniref:Uncharacterized protein n=1 Tax=Trachymyrmex cornetzi TaxID=471704 RepID=A0A195DRR2_9HYME|nr:hypothetical protein ALC57_12118 [Trachymyrmex cornetzi]